MLIFITNEKKCLPPSLNFDGMVSSADFLAKVDSVPKTKAISACANGSPPAADDTGSGLLELALPLNQKVRFMYFSHSINLTNNKRITTYCN